MAMTLTIPTLSDQLQKVVNRIETLETEKAEVAAALREAFKEAKDEGLDIKALKELLKLRKSERHEVLEQRATVNNYLHALGMM